MRAPSWAPLLLLAGLLSASGEETGEPLTLSRAIELALTRNLDLQVERFTPKIAEQAVDKARASFDPTATFSYNEKDSRTASISTLSGAPTVIQHTTTYAGGMK